MTPWFRSSPSREDSSVAAVEQIHADAASRRSGSVPLRDDKAVVNHALSICTCYTFEAAPTWLIHDVPEGGSPGAGFLTESNRSTSSMRASWQVDMLTPRRCCAGCKGTHPTPGRVATAAATQSCCRSFTTGSAASDPHPDTPRQPPNNGWCGLVNLDRKPIGDWDEWRPSRPILQDR